MSGWEAAQHIINALAWGGAGYCALRVIGFLGTFSDPANITPHNVGLQENYARLAGIYTMFALMFMVVGCTADTGQAEGLAKEFAAENFPDHGIVNIKSARTDSDGDGYCSVNMSLKKPSGDTMLVPLECTCEWSLFGPADQCRSPKAAAQ